MISSCRSLRSISFLFFESWRIMGLSPVVGRIGTTTSSFSTSITLTTPERRWCICKQIILASASTRQYRSSFIRWSLKETCEPIEQLQADLDDWTNHYNTKRIHWLKKLSAKDTLRDYNWGYTIMEGRTCKINHDLKDHLQQPSDKIWTLSMPLFLSVFDPRAESIGAGDMVGIRWQLITARTK